ncbi:MAG: helix-turn-helix domain-containing protein [Thomasclavelia sp.]|jgi:transcriptional regulator with XRE-family HTH domain|nr:helix-turn-helix domain-containing protein [Thomasclavelia sp.]
MNIEIANRLVQMRKEKGLSQEALANELGVSRQAVSKWERAESSPDTDNLITLAKLYGVSLDELLSSDQKKFESGDKMEDSKEEPKKKDKVDISFREGIHVSSKEGDEVHVGWNGVHVHDAKEGHEVHVDGDGVNVDGKEYDKKDFISKPHFPLEVIIIVAYIFIGFYYNLWHPGWLLLFLIPILESFVSAIKHRDPTKFAYPVLAGLIFLFLGFEYNLWHPTWILFITVPLYYAFFGYFKKRKKYKESINKE